MKQKTNYDLMATDKVGLVIYCQDLHIELERLRSIEFAARNLIKVKDRHHTEIAYKKLDDACK